MYMHVADYDSSIGKATLQLVETNAHKATVPHQGSVKQFEQAHGVKYGSKGAVQGVQDRGRLANPIKRRGGCK